MQSRPWACGWGSERTSLAELGGESLETRPLSVLPTTKGARISHQMRVAFRDGSTYAVGNVVAKYNVVQTERRGGTVRKMRHRQCGRHTSVLVKQNDIAKGCRLGRANEFGKPVCWRSGAPVTRQTRAASVQGYDTYTIFPRLSRIAVGSSNLISLANAASLADYYRLATKFQGSELPGSKPVAGATHLVS